MSRGNSFGNGPPLPASRGIPRAGQNPDPSWFGRRAPGERGFAAQVEESNASAISLSDLIREHWAAEGAVFQYNNAVQAHDGASFIGPTISQLHVDNVPISISTNGTLSSVYPNHWSYEAPGWNVWTPMITSENQIHCCAGISRTQHPNITEDELMAAMEEAVEQLLRNKNAAPSAMNPGARWAILARNLTIQE